MILDSNGNTVMPGRKLEDMSANELRAKLYNADVKYPANASRQDLIRLIRENIKYHLCSHVTTMYKHLGTSLRRPYFNKEENNMEVFP